MAEAVHPEAEHAAGVLSGLLQRHLPGRLAGLHLIGSAVDGDFQPGRSSLDVVGVFHDPVTDDEYEALGIVHRLYISDGTLPLLDGIWITTADLRAGPDRTPDGPTTRDGLLIGVARGNRNPATWASLRDGAVTLAGTLDRGALWDDPDRLLSWTRETVDGDWVPWLRRASSFATLAGLSMLGRRAPARAVFGMSRLYHTVATGRIASKSAAGAYAKTAFDRRWHRILDEALDSRHGRRSRYGNPIARRRDALSFIAMVIDLVRNQPGS